MDREQERLQHLGFFGIFRESFKFIFSWPKIFSQITLSLIFPLSIIFLAHTPIAQVLFERVLFDQYRLAHCSSSHSTYRCRYGYDNLADMVTIEWSIFWAFKFVYFTFVLIFSLLATAAVVYLIACKYTCKEITFKKVMSVVPRVWKRLMVTFLWSYLMFFVYHILAVVVLVLWVLYGRIGFITGLVVGIVLYLLYMVGFVYISVIWNLASVISVLEDIKGLKAMKKSRELIKGKMGAAVGMFVVLFIFFAGIQVVFIIFVVYGVFEGLMIRLAFGIFCLLLLFMVVLLGLVVQTVTYFVCKSYHRESIDKSSLADHLEVIYLGDYAPLKGNKDVQLEQVHVVN